MLLLALRQVMSEFQITQRELAARSGISEGTISRAFNGNTDAFLSSYERLIQALPEPAAQRFFELLPAYWQSHLQLKCH